MRQIACFIPKWLETLPQDHDMKQRLIHILKEQLKDGENEEWQNNFAEKMKALPFVKNVFIEDTQEEGILRVQIAVKEEYYYSMLSELTGITIDGEYQLISLIRELCGRRKEYEAVGEAMKSVKETGYGVILPGREDVRWEEPVMTHSGNRYGVKMKAASPTIHLIKAEIDTEIAPIVGSENQAEDLIAYIHSGTQESEGIWEINIFGKTVEQLLQEEMTVKLNQFGEESRQKIQKVIGRVLDENKNGMICLII